MATNKNTKYAFILPATGNPYRVSFNKKREMEAIQALVGGFFETLDTKNIRWLQPERDFARIVRRGKVYVNDDRKELEWNPHLLLEEITMEGLKAMPRRVRQVWGNIVIVMTALRHDRLVEAEEWIMEEDIRSISAFPYEGTYFP